MANLKKDPRYNVVEKDRNSNQKTSAKTAVEHDESPIPEDTGSNGISVPRVGVSLEIPVCVGQCHIDVSIGTIGTAGTDCVDNRTVALNITPAKGQEQAALSPANPTQSQTKKPLQKKSRSSSPSKSQVTAEEPVLSLTDMGNAERFVDRYQDELAYCQGRGGWQAWSGKHWEVDSDCHVTRRAKAVVRSLREEAKEASDPALKGRIEKHARASETLNRINSLVGLARDELAVPGGNFNREPFLLTCENGAIDLRTGKLLPHSPKHRLTTLAPVTYRPGAKAPLWDSLLKTAMDGDSELIGYLQRAFGYFLTGDVSEQCIFVFHGTGANGKSTITNTFLRLLGNHAIQGESDLLLQAKSGGHKHPTGLTDLRDRRLVVCQENDPGRMLSEALVKQLTGGDRLRARRMRQDFFEFDPTHKIILATNHRPRIQGTDVGIWRRMRLIPFRIRVPDDQDDKHLEEKLELELPGILNWALKGCKDWQKNGLDTPKAVLEETKLYRESQDLLQRFMDSECSRNVCHTTTIDRLYEAYRKWCISGGEPKTTRSEFQERLLQKGFSVGVCKSGKTKGKMVCYHLGLA